MPSLYRTALQVSPERVAALNDRELNDLMRALLNAQAYLSGANTAEVLVNTEGLAADGGADGVSPAPPRADTWLGDSETVWQFKAGTAGEPSRLKQRHEVRKSLPKAVLERGGRFVVIASGSTAGEQGEHLRKAALVEDAHEAGMAGIPSERIVVLGSESLTTWCNQHPAIAAQWAGRPGGLWRIPDWKRSGEHDVEWQPVDVQREAMAKLWADLDFDTGQVLHAHIFGHPGVGKSRFAFELCRGAPWHEFVIYIRQAADIRLQELLDSCADDVGVRLIVVADEVEFEQIVSLRASVARANGRVRLVTIGPSASPDPERVPGFEVEPLPERVVAGVVRRWHPGMPVEHAEFVARFSAGYMRLARLASDTVQRNSSMDVRTILEQPQIRAFLDKMLGNGERSALHVVSVLTFVGWTDDCEAEGKAIAAHLGLDWGRVRQEVEAFDRRFHIAPRSGRFRNISPTPLGVYLALEAWTIYPRELRSLPTILPAAAVDAYYDRLQLLASSPQAGGFAREELDRFFPVADLTDVRAIRRWSALAFADPMMAASQMRAELARRTRDEREAIRGPARHSLVGGLVALSWSSATFEDAVHGLALLAEAENDTVANNATAEFLQRFSIFFSATAVPYTVRMHVLDALLMSQSGELRKLGFHALGSVASRRGSRSHRMPVTRGLPEPEWQPATVDEHVTAARLGIARMRTAIETGDTVIGDIAAAVVSKLKMFLLEEPVRAEILDLISATARTFPLQREALRQSVSELLYSDRKHWHRLGPEADAAVEAVLRELEDRSISGRLRQAIGAGSREESESLIRSIASEFVERPELLADEWAWLTGGEGRHAWAFGSALGTTNLDRVIDDLISSPAMGSDGRVVCAYWTRRSGKEGSEWLEAWLDRLWEIRRDRADLVLEAAWRLTPTDRGARRVLEILEAGYGSPAMIAQLAYGTWEENLEQATLRPILEALSRRDDGRNTAVAMLRQRLQKHRDELDQWAELALLLVTDGRQIRNEHHDDWQWCELAKLIVDRYPREIYRAIVREQGRREEQHWFLEHELAADIVWLCVERDPVGAWEETRPYLEAADGQAFMFAVGFPEGLVDMMDHATVLEWVAADPIPRASVLADIVAKTYSDETLAGKLIERYGSDEEVAGVFHSRSMSGHWVGSPADHWGSLARSMRAVAESARGPMLRRWAVRAADLLDQMEARDRLREEEEFIREP